MRRKLILWALLVALLAGLGYGAWWGGAYLYLGTGHAAKMAGSAVFVSGRELPPVVAEDLAAEGVSLWLLDVALDRGAGEVKVSAAGGLVTRRARDRGVLGVTLVGDDGLFPPATPAGLEPIPAGDPWPAGDLDGEQRRAMKAVIDQAFAEPGSGGVRLLTRAVLVARDGELVAERYAEGFDRHLPQLGWSMTKSVTNALIGIAIQAGLIERDAPAPVPLWREPGDPRRGITVAQLLRMSSGLAFSDQYDGPRDKALQMLYRVDDMASFAASQPLVASPGTVFHYSGGTTNILSGILKWTIADREAYLRFPREHLFAPLGMSTAVLETDRSETYVGSSFLQASPGDWLRFGQFMLQDGVWKDDRLLPEGWVPWSTTPAPVDESRGYGAQWWLNRGEGEHRALPGVPADAFFASGHNGQFLVIIPSREIVVLRMGMTNKRDAFDLDGLVAGVLDALGE